MGIFDRFRHKAHDATDEAKSSLGGMQEQGSDAMSDPAQRAALAHDEAADAFLDESTRAGDTQPSTKLSEEEQRARDEMTAEGDPWD
ncbi:hypothetical protein [Kitasatospora sp. NPDC050543]|uniref:hypothetical protein n=1 Tax=Kitasatospora sp. NPDC050543 TaxID=3364054 RepID=UPI0037A37BCA